MTRPILLVLGAAASVQFGASLAVTLFDQAGPAGTVLLRLAFASVFLLVLWRPWRGPLSPADRRAVILFGLALAGMNGFYYAALDRIDQGVTVTFQMVGPLAVAVLGTRRAIDLLWVALAAGGVLLLTSGGEDLNTLGVAFAVTAGGFWAAYILLSARVGRALPGASGLALAMVVGTAAVAPGGVAAGGADLLHLAVLGTGVGVALLSTVIPYTLEMEALRALRPQLFGVLMSLHPAAAALAGFVVLGQRLGPAEVVAIALVVTASAGAARTAGEAVPPPVVD